MGGVLLGLLVQVGFGPPFSFLHRREKEGEGEGEGKGGAAPSPSPIWTPMGGAATPCGLLSTKAHVGPIFPRGVPVTPQYNEIYLNLSETIPVSEYHRPIYQSLLLGHFKTPRRVRDLIRDSEQTSVTKNT